MQPKNYGTAKILVNRDVQYYYDLAVSPETEH